MPATFNGLNTTQKQAVRLSPIIDLSSVRRVNSAVINFTADVPANTTLLVETNVSLDGGVTWLGWKTATSGGAIADLALGTYVKTGQLQIRHTLTTTTGLNIPVVKSTGVVLTPLMPKAVWMSQEYSLQDYAIDLPTTSFVTTSTPNGGTVSLFMRTRLKDDSSWTAWQAQPDGALVQKNAIAQFKAELDPVAPYSTSPVLDKLQALIPPTEKSGVWISNLIDVSKATDKSTGKVSIASTIGSGKLVVYSRSQSASTGVTPSAWYVALEDGTLMHPVNNFVQVMLVMEGANISVNEVTVLFDGDAAVTLIGTDLTPGAQYSYTTLRDKLIIANGKDVLKKWDGITPMIENVPNTPPLIKFLVTHQNRVWGVDAENTSRVRFSNILDPEKWDAYDFMDFNPEDGDYITCAMKYGQNLMVSKQRSMAMLTGNKSSNYSITWLEAEQGCSSPRGMCQADKYIAYVAQDGVRFTDLSQSIIATERLSDEWERVNKRRLSQACVAYWRNKLFVALPVNESLVNNEVWVYDFLRNSWSIREGWSVAEWLKFNQYGEDILLSGSSETGQVHQVDITEYDDGIPVEYLWRSKDFHFNAPERYKLFRNIYLDISGVADRTDLYVDLIVDGVIVGTYHTEIPAGAEVKTTRRILPPLYNAVLGSTLTIQLRGRCGIQGITIEYVLRGAIPGGNM